MYDKNKCKTCKYRAMLKGYILCDYSNKSENGTALKRCGKGIIDTRGGDPNKCLLYEKGKPNKGKYNFYI